MDKYSVCGCRILTYEFRRSFLVLMSETSALTWGFQVGRGRKGLSEGTEDLGVCAGDKCDSAEGHIRCPGVLSPQGLWVVDGCG